MTHQDRVNRHWRGYININRSWLRSTYHCLIFVMLYLFRPRRRQQ